MLKLFKNFTSQRGAMFGLDARIALAIFGTITVAAGYVGVSKIETARDAALYKEILAIEDAMEQMQTDLGVFYQFAIQTSDFVNDINALNDKSLLKTKYQSRWNGPYLEGFDRNNARFGTYDVRYRGGCTISNSCTVMIRLTNVARKTWDRFNRMVDENNGTAPEGDPTNQGRVQGNGGTDPINLFYYTRITRQAG